MSAYLSTCPGELAEIGCIGTRLLPEEVPAERLGTIQQRPTLWLGTWRGFSQRVRAQKKTQGSPLACGRSGVLLLKNMALSAILHHFYSCLFQLCLRLSVAAFHASLQSFQLVVANSECVRIDGCYKFFWRHLFCRCVCQHAVSVHPSANLRGLVHR